MPSLTTYARGLGPGVAALLLAVALPAAETTGLARIHDADPIVRERASLAAARSGEMAALPLLVASVRQNVRLGNREAVVAFSWFGAAAVPSLQELLADPDPFCRAEALRAVRALGPTAAPLAEAAAAALRDDNRYVRFQAALALAAIGPAAQAQTPALLTAIENDAWNRRRVIAALAAVGDAAALRRTLAGPHGDQLLAALSAQPAACRSVQSELLALAADGARLPAALRALGHLGPAAASVVPAIAGALATAAVDDAVAALRQLGPVAAGHETALARAIRTGQPGGGTRGEVVPALRAVATPAARTALLGFAREGGLRGDTRLAALDAAFAIDGAERAAVLTELLTDPDGKVVRGVLERLQPGQAGTEALVAAFERAATPFRAQLAALRQQAEAGAKSRKPASGKKDKAPDQLEPDCASLAAGLVLCQDASHAAAAAWLPELLSAAAGTAVNFDAGFEKNRKEAIAVFVRRAPPAACAPLRERWEGDEAGPLLELFTNAVANPPLARHLETRARALLQHADPRVQVAAAMIVLRAGVGDAAPAVAALVAGTTAQAADPEDDRQVARAAEARRAALVACGRAAAHAAAVRPALERARRSDSWRERDAAEDSLRQLASANTDAGQEGQP